MFFHIDNKKLLEKCKAIWTKIEDLKNIELDALPVYDDRCIKTKIRTCSDKIYTNFCDLNVPEDYIKCESFRSFFTCIGQEILNRQIVNRQMTDYLDEIFF